MDTPAGFPNLTNTTCNDAFYMKKAFRLVFENMNPTTSGGYGKITTHFQFAEIDSGATLVLQYSSMGTAPWSTVGIIAHQ